MINGLEDLKSTLEDIVEGQKSQNALLLRLAVAMEKRNEMLAQANEMSREVIDAQMKSLAKSDEMREKLVNGDLELHLTSGGACGCSARSHVSGSHHHPDCARYVKDAMTGTKEGELKVADGSRLPSIEELNEKLNQPPAEPIYLGIASDSSSLCDCALNSKLPSPDHNKLCSQWIAF